MEVPGEYLLDAKIYPLDTKYVLKVLKYAIPKSQKKIMTYTLDGPPQVSTHDELYSDDQYDGLNCVLQLQKHIHGVQSKNMASTNVELIKTVVIYKA